MTPTFIKTTSGLEHLDTIIADVQSLIDNKQDFVGFVIIAVGIEFMGSFYDGNDFNDFGQSKARFKNALSTLFKDKRYRNKQEWLFENFRGPLIHQYRPSDEMLLTSKCKDNAPVDTHWKSFEGKTVFVLEQLFEDLKSAIQKFKNEIEKASTSLDKDKINGEYMCIKEVYIHPEDKIFGEEFQSFPSSGTTRVPHLGNSKKKPK
jgi:hypothetical protein